MDENKQIGSGGVVANKLTVDRPDLLKKLVIISCSVRAVVRLPG